jgi:PAS domain S-box-containing protein
MERKGTEAELERRVLERTHELALAIDGLRAEIAERLRAEKKIAYQANLLANVSDAILATDADLQLTSWNRAAEQIYGWPAAEVLGKPMDEVLRSEYLGVSAEAAVRRLLETGEFNAVAIQYHKDNHPIYIEGKTIALRDEAGQVTGFVSVNRNITERSQNEEANRQMAAELNSVHRRLIENVEAERLFLSQELHDGPIQVLHGMVFKLAPALATAKEPETQALLTELRQLSLDLIGSLRSNSNDLRPPALAPFGLEKAIRSHAEMFAIDHPEIEVSIDLDSDGQRLPERVRLAMFRIYQQALVNILKHAQANRVRVEFRVDLDNAILRIEDNGVGFEAPDRLISLAREGHLGLVGAAERAAAVGGQLKVDSQPGKGTMIQVEVPY